MGKMRRQLDVRTGRQSGKKCSAKAFWHFYKYPFTRHLHFCGVEDQLGLHSAPPEPAAPARAARESVTVAPVAAPQVDLPPSVPSFVRPRPRPALVAAPGWPRPRESGL